MPQGFRTFQILLAVGFLSGFFVVLVGFVWKISELNVDLNRVSFATQMRAQLQKVFADGRACEMNFAGLQLSDAPISIPKIVDIRNQVILRAEKSVQDSEIHTESLRLFLGKVNNEASPALAEVFLELTFADEISGRQSPVRLQIDAVGASGEESQFQIQSCQLSSNGVAE